MIGCRESFRPHRVDFRTSIANDIESDRRSTPSGQSSVFVFEFQRFRFDSIDAKAVRCLAGQAGWIIG